MRWPGEQHLSFVSSAPNAKDGCILYMDILCILWGLYQPLTPSMQPSRVPL